MAALGRRAFLGWKTSPNARVAIDCNAILFKSLQIQPKRFLNLHEHTNFDLLRTMGIRVPTCQVASTPEEAADIIRTYQGEGADDFMMKAQVLTGGRGKGHFDNGFQGGVKRLFTEEEAKQLSSNMIGHNLITKQTGAGGMPCQKVLLTQRIDSKREYYFSIIMDRKSSGPMMIGSSAGGVDIEETAESNPDAIIREPIDIDKGMSKEQAMNMAHRMGFRPQFIDSAANTIEKLYEVFMKYDVTMLEINPFAEVKNGEVACLDCKINFDDNADYRQKEIFSYRDRTQENPQEADASRIGLNYVHMDGDIGCLVNGAGLAMATMDLIKLHGGSPANFLDIGGGASIEQVTKAFELIISHQGVNAILVNIFGGIVRCDSVAGGLIKVAETLHLEVPIVVRLQGTNLREAIDLMDASPMKIHSYVNLDEAANKVVKMAAIRSVAKQHNIPIEFSLAL